MKSSLAEKLLVRILDWSDDEVRVERPLIQAIANFKYDEYQQYSLGIRFIENLVVWLDQFSEISERREAYEFVKSRLIFFSNDQIMHLVQMAFSDKLNPILLKKAAKLLDIDNYKVRHILKSDEYAAIKRRSLFIAMSDGARIDYLRRFSGINNEQVIPTYQINDAKADDMLGELKNEGYTNKFSTIFLIDDFTASGTSYFRVEQDGKTKGKIAKILDSFGNKELNKLISQDESIDIIILFYVATEYAVQKIKNSLNKWKKDNPESKFEFEIKVLQILKDDIKINENTDKSIIDISKKYIDKSIIDRHFEKAKHKKYYLGYDECALPLILHHNTPNNSIPLLWWTNSNKNFIGLFPRITRHE